MELYKTKLAWILGGFEYLHADDLIANAGSGGATFRTDQLLTGQHVPYTKLMSGTADDTAVIPGDATNGLFVQVKTSAAIPVTDNSSSLTVDNAGTFATQAAQSGTWTVQPGNTANTTAWKVDGSAVTQPVSASALPLPTGAATETTLAALNTKTATAKTSDYDTGAGTDTVPMMGIALPASGGAVQGGTATNPVRTDPTGTTAQPITDNSGTLTVDSPQLPAALGQTTMSASLPVALASNQSALPITDNSGSLTVDNGGTFAVQATVAASATNIAKTEDAVAADADVGVPALAVRRDSASSGVSADGDYAMLSVDSTGALRVTGGGGGTQYAEDTAHVSGDTGTLSLAVRRDANTTLVDTTGDYAPLQVDASGSLKVAITAGAGSGGTSLADKAAFTEGSTSMTPVGGVYNETISADPTEDQAAAVRITAKRALHVNLRDSSGNELSAGNQYAEDAAHTSGDLGTMALVRRSDSAASSAGTDGDYATMNTDSSGRLWVNASGAAVPVTDNSGSLTVDNGGTFAVQATIASGATSIAKAEDVASADADVGVPAMMVRKATPANTSGTDGDYEMLQGSAGRLWVDPSGVTLTVASHAVTNAGTFAVQATLAAGSANIAKAEDVASADADVGVPAMAIRKAAPANTSGTDGDYEMLQMSAGRLWASATIDAALPTGANVIGALSANQSVNVAQINGVTTLMGNGVTGTGSQRVTIASDNTAFSVNAVESGTWTVQPGNTANTTPWLTTQTPATSGGLTISRTLAAASTNATSVKGSAGQVFGWFIYNASASAKFLKLYNTASAPTAGSGTPVMTIPIPATSAANCEFANGIAFGTGIGFTMTGAVADNDTTALAANDLILNLLYK